MILDDCYASFLNLPHRQDRLRKMERELTRVGLSAVRTPGVATRNLINTNRGFRVMYERTPGAVGCYIGQIQIMREALERGKHAFVMEDDLVFCDDLPRRLDVAEEFLADNPWDVFWLGGTYHVNPPVWHKDTLGRDAELTYNPRMIRTFGCWSTYAYIVNRDSIDKVLNLLEGCRSRSIGIDWSFIQLQPQLRTYAFVPGCVKQYDNRSDIGSGMTRFSGFAQLGPYWWQQYALDFDPEKFDWAEARRA